jgi:TIR domain-containing protein/von Hippel-Lindau disease tumor suppressor protein
MTAAELFLFVSHVTEDRAAAMEVVEELERRGVRCWIAPRDVNPGKPFDNEIAAAIETSRAMLLIFSEHCNESDYIRREVTVAGESQKVIIPFRIENAQPKRGLRVRLSDLHWIDGFASRERAIDELVKTFHPPNHDAAPKAAADQLLGERAPRVTHKSVADEGPRRGEARPQWLQSRLALLIGSLVGAAMLGAIGVWLALTPKSQSSVTSDRPAPVRDPRESRCAEEGQIKSIDGKQPTVITFSNDSGSPVRQYWLDYSGQRKFYSTIKQGESHTQPTFFTHPWMITDSVDKCIAIYLPDGRGSPISIH